MKLYHLLLTLLFPISLVAQQSIRFEETSFVEILQKAKKEKKLVFLDAYASWCGPCKMMERNIFPLKSVSDYYNAHFINAHFDMEKGEGISIAQKYGVRSYPTYLFINGDGELIMSNYGYLSEADFLAIAEEANHPDNLKYTLKQRFENGETSPNFLINTMKQYAETDFVFAKKVSERYFAHKKLSDFTKDDVGLLFYFLQSNKDPNYQFFVDNKATILQFVPENAYTEFDNNLKISSILENALSEDKKSIDDAKYYAQAIPLIGKQQAEKQLNKLKINYYLKTANYKEYEKIALIYYQNTDQFDIQELLKAAYIFSEYVQNPSSLSIAKQWAEKVVMQSETPESTYVLAKLYKETGNKDLAKMFAETSKRLAEQSGGDASLANQLLKDLP